MAEQFGEKSEAPTPHRREKAREQGQVAKSQDLSSAALLLIALFLIMFLGGGITEFLQELLRRRLGDQPMITMDVGLIMDYWNEMSYGLFQTLLPLLGFLLLGAMIVNVAQVGILFLPQKVNLDLKHINPLKGLQRLFSLSSAMRLAFGIFKILVVVAVAAWSLWADRATIISLASLEIQQVAYFLYHVILWTSIKIGVALLILALLDYAYQRWKHEQDLKMTTQEVREEMKSLQGDPQMIARRRAVQRQLALNRLGSAVPEADVVVTNPTELSIAIQYDPETMLAPIVLAKGAGVLAQKIRRLALENDIPIVERKSLAQYLYKEVEVNDPVPAEQYAAVAEVLRYVYELKGKELPTLDQDAA